MTDFEGVRNMSGNVTNGKTIESATCDTARRILRLERPNAMATIVESIKLRGCVIRREWLSRGKKEMSTGRCFPERQFTEILQRMKPSETTCLQR